MSFHIHHCQPIMAFSGVTTPAIKQMIQIKFDENLAFGTDIYNKVTGLNVDFRTEPWLLSFKNTFSRMISEATKINPELANPITWEQIEKCVKVGGRYEIIAIKYVFNKRLNVIQKAYATTYKKVVDQQYDYRQLFHGTDESAVAGIIRSGNKYGSRGMCGFGVNCSRDIGYALQFAKPNKENEQSVLVMKCFMPDGHFAKCRSQVRDFGVNANGKDVLWFHDKDSVQKSIVFVADSPNAVIPALQIVMKLSNISDMSNDDIHRLVMYNPSAILNARIQIEGQSVLSGGKNKFVNGLGIGSSIPVSLNSITSVPIVSGIVRKPEHVTKWPSGKNYISVGMKVKVKDSLAVMYFCNGYVGKVKHIIRYVCTDTIFLVEVLGSNQFKEVVRQQNALTARNKSEFDARLIPLKYSQMQQTTEKLSNIQVAPDSNDLLKIEIERKVQQAKDDQTFFQNATDRKVKNLRANSNLDHVNLDGMLSKITKTDVKNQAKKQKI